LISIKKLLLLRSPKEMLTKNKILLKKENVRNKIANCGNDRFAKEHCSHKDEVKYWRK
jgi:spore maturation protein CgeB